MPELDLKPLEQAEKAAMQKLFISGHLLPGVDLTSNHILQFVDKLGKVTEMNIFHGPTIKTPEDINVTWMWDDSGGSIYVFPNKDHWCVVDLHTCKSFDTKRTLEVVYNELAFREDMRFAEQTHNISTDWALFSLESGAPLTPEKKFLADFERILKVDLADPKQLVPVGENLEKMVYQAVKEGWGDRLAAVFNKRVADKIRDIHSAFEIATDDAFMTAVLEGRANDADQYAFQPTYDRLAKMEAEAAGMKKGKAVMHIGTGWPGTAIGLNKLGIPVTCVEIRPQVARKSKNALEKLGLIGTNKLRVVNFDGTKLNPEGFAAVIISAMVPNNDKLQILDNLRRLATGEEMPNWPTYGPPVVLRTPPDRAKALFYQELTPDLLTFPGLELIRKTNPEENDPLQSLVFKMHPTASAKRMDEVQLVQARQKLTPTTEAVI